MRKVVILHGICDKEEYFDMDFPSPSNAHWLPWLQQKFLRAGALCQILEMPTPYAPKYQEWVETFEQLALDNDSIIIGHSAGCGFILKWLHENRDQQFSKLILVAPYLDPNKEQGDFLQIDLECAVQDQVSEIHLFNSKDDDEDILQTTTRILETYSKVSLYNYDDMGHFTFDSTGATFPDLWNIAKPE